jgi:hypothetical protein
MLEYLGLDKTSIGMFSSILSAKSLAVVDSILDTAGIISLDGVERLESDDDNDGDEIGEAPEAVDDAQAARGTGSPRTEASSLSASSYLLVTPADGSHSRSKSADHAGRGPFSRSSHRPSLSFGRRPSLSFDRRPSSEFSSVFTNFSTPATSISIGPTPGDRTEHYKKLLVAVVRAAQNLAAVPQCGMAISTLDIPSLLSLSEVDCALQGSDRNDQVCAAGELFVSFSFAFGHRVDLYLLGL